MNLKSHTSNQGSVLAITLIITAVLGVIAGSFLRNSISGMQFTEVTLHQNGLLNLAEAGAEKALYALNQDDWSEWGVSADGSLVLDSDVYDLGRGNMGGFTAVVSNFGATNPLIRVESRIADGFQNSTTTKQIQIALGRRSVWMNGMTSERYFLLRGGANFYHDSFDSREVPDGIYQLVLRRDNGSIASNMVEDDAVDLGSAEIYGFVATGGAMPNFHTRNAKIYGEDTDPDTNIDMSRIAMDFSTYLEPVNPPSTLGAASVLPPEDSSTGITTIGSPGGEVQVFDLTDINLKGDLVIDGPVVIVSRGDVNIGNNDVTLTENGSSVMYFAGDFDAGGNAVVNNQTNLAENFILYGIHSEPGKHTLNMRGNAAITAAVYAPYANVEFRGGGARGSFTGAVVAYSITIRGGNLNVHYDEALRDFSDDGSFRMLNWRELFAANERLDFSQWTAVTSEASSESTSRGLVRILDILR